MIQLTKEEAQQLIAQLAEIPAKYSFNIIAFLNQKLQNADKPKEEKF